MSRAELALYSKANGEDVREGRISSVGSNDSGGERGSEKRRSSILRKLKIGKGKRKGADGKDERGGGKEGRRTNIFPAYKSRR